jgi:hypothetical protein
LVVRVWPGFRCAVGRALRSVDRLGAQAQNERLGSFQDLKSSHGGRRPGAGRKRGTRWPSTIAKEHARELVRQAVTRELQALIEAQIANALGIQYLVVREVASGKFVRVTEAFDRQKIGKDQGVIEVWSKGRSGQAFTDLINPALDKLMEQPHEIRVTGDEEQIPRLHAGRARAAAGRAKTAE